MDLQSVNNLEELEKLFASRMTAYEDKLQKFSAPGVAHSDITSLSAEFTEFKNFVWLTLTKLKTQMQLLAIGLERHETVMRRKVLLFHGLPEKPNEKLHETISKVLSDQMKVSEISMNNLHVCHRLGSSQGKNRPTLVRFYDYEHRQIVWEQKTALKGTGITISEFLTPSRHKVFMAARKHFGVKRTWTVEGKIVILLPNQSRKKIECLSELQQLISLHPCEISDAADSAKNIAEPSSPKDPTLKNTIAPRRTRRR